MFPDYSRQGLLLGYHCVPGKHNSNRVSHQYGNTFNFNFLILYQCYCKSKTSSEKLRSKPSRGHLDFDFFQKIRLFFRVDKKRNKTEILFGAMPPFFFKMSQDFVFSDSCTRVHEFEEKTKFHVPGYMKFWFSLFLCVAQAVEVARHKKNILFWHFFLTFEKINQFWEFCKDEGGKI